MAAPRGADWLADEMRALSTWGIDTVVSMLTASEEYELGLEDERIAADDAGLRFVAFPVPDRGVPPRPTAHGTVISHFPTQMMLVVRGSDRGTMGA